MRTRGTLPIAFAMLICAGSSWGAITSCSSIATGSNFNTYTPSGLGTGCSSVNVTFENLSVSSPVATGGGVTETASNNNIYATGTAASGNTIGPVNAFLDPSTAANWVLSGLFNTGTTGATLNYVAIAHTGGTYPSPATAGLSWVFGGLILNPTATAGSGDTATITMHFCVNATTTAGCLAANLGTITASYASSSTPAFTCTFGSAGCVSATSNTVNFGSSTLTQIAISEVYLISKPGNPNSTVSITNIEDQFLETTLSPEPSTFGLFGVGLAGLFILRQRRRPRSAVL